MQNFLKNRTIEKKYIVAGKQFVLYIMSGILSLAANLTVATAAELMFLNRVVSISIGYLVGLIVVALINSSITFDTGLSRKILVRFCIVAGLNLFLAIELSGLFEERSMAIQIFIYTPAVTVVGFVLNKFYVFKGRRF